MTVYLWTIFLRFRTGGLDYVSGIAMPTNVLLLSGLSALTFGGAKLITAQKVSAEVEAGKPNPKLTAAPAATPPAPAATPPAPAATPPAPAATVAKREAKLSDLFQNDYGDVSLGDFQMIFITVTAVIIYLVTSGRALTDIPLQAHVVLPDVDTSLLGAFGLSQGAYLAKKMALPPGKG
jgi:hypothetical protein